MPLAAVSHYFGVELHGGPEYAGVWYGPALLLYLLAAVSCRGAQLTVSTPLGQVRSIAQRTTVSG